MSVKSKDAFMKSFDALKRDVALKIFLYCKYVFRTQSNIQDGAVCENS